ncbi:hypothetical protein AAL_05543 [Moelleriella libera RCEF 2490]|uniref:Uncharacterized protein n=1 Tax=Moelleriella libera RCEF 2490 TaxID=1081109 RepID=A0A168AEF7_9HYPO|nr:hypothetical protein AAL_05543 [Moelleriella libera RCEF 2490]
MAEAYITPDSEKDRERQRRRQNDSSETNSSGEFNIRSLKYRHAIPAGAPLPVQNIFDGFSGKLMLAFQGILYKDIPLLLQKAGVKTYRVEDDLCEIIITKRRSPRSPSDDHLTLLIKTPWEDDSMTTWGRAIVMIKKYVDDLLDNDEWRHVALGVEMLAPELFLKKYVAPEIGNARLESDWPVIANQVYSILQSFSQTRNKMTQIALFRLGYSENPGLNPITVYITLRYSSDDSKWHSVLVKLQQVLDGFPHGLVPFMEHNEMDEFAFETVPVTVQEDNINRDPTRYLAEYSDKVAIGADICASVFTQRDDGTKRNPVMGTLGCFVEIQIGQEPWRTMSLTNYHVVRSGIEGFGLKAVKDAHGNTNSAIDKPAEGSPLWACDKEGICSLEGGICLENPARPTLSIHLEVLKVRGKQLDHLIQRGQDPKQKTQEKAERSRVQDQLKRKQAFFDKNRHQLGTVKFASGLLGRTSTPNPPQSLPGRRLDWALAAVAKGRQVTNIIPGPSHPSMPLPTCVYGWLQPCSTIKAGELPYDMDLYKNGAASGTTRGRWLGTYQSIVALPHDSHLNGAISSEFMVFGEPKDSEFAKPGDSGAVVFTDNGEAIGLVFTGSRPHQTKAAYTYVTPLADIFADIRARVGKALGKKVNVRLLQEPKTS